ncbi:MAG: dockerin type I domain-containing protein [Clostridiales bacterium]|nr:dockerin type I domain-containing protein [Clostridiales bacterium]
MKRFNSRVIAIVLKILAVIPFSVLIIMAAVNSDYEFKTVKAGDVDGDGLISNTDITYILSLASDLLSDTSLPASTSAVIDIDGDGKITAYDAHLLGESREDGNVVILSSDDAEAQAAEALVNSISLGQSQSAVDGAVAVSGEITDYSIISNDKMYIYPDLSQVMEIQNSFVIISFGWGHGVGMSQRGALALARAGYSYIQIIQHYYYGVAIMKENYPSTVKCSGKDVDTVEMLARIIQQEIAGITTANDSLDMNALRAQAVAAYSNLKYSGYTVQGCSYVNNYSSCRDDVKQVAAEIAGQFIEYNGEVVYAYYSAVSAGVSATYEQVWGSTSKDMGYLYNASSYYDCNTSDYVRATAYSPQTIKNYILSYDSSIELSDDPAEWIEILTHDDAVNENIGYVSAMRIGNRVISSGAGMIFRDNIMDYEVRSPCFAIIYNGEYL